MKKIKFTEHVLPHMLAVAVFLLVTFIFFSPVFLENKTLDQPDIQYFKGSAKEIQDYRDNKGEEALWAGTMFSGMPAYLVSVEWGNGPVALMKNILSVWLPHPINNIFLCFVCYYVLLLVFGVRPYLAIGGAIAFGLSSYVIIGLGAGHNGRIGAIAFMPLVMAGIHLVFSGRRVLGFGVAAAALALHLRENHLQITYYLLIIVLVYGLIRLIEAIREKTLGTLFQHVGILLVAAIIAVGTFFGQMWAVSEYTAHSIRGKSDLEIAQATGGNFDAKGISKEYAFDYSNGILEPFTLLIPNFYGGSTASLIIEDRNSETFRALQNAMNSGNQQLVNQLYPMARGYWGPQFNTSPYYAGAIIVFLFVLGILFAEKRYVWWLVPLSILSIMLSWGKSFESFNYFVFDYFPGYNKFRSVTFTLIIILFAMPLLGFMGLERYLSSAKDKAARRKLLIALGSTGGLCLLFILFAGMFSFVANTADLSDLPDWFVNALIDDRKDLFRADAFRSLAFITAIFIVIYFDVHKRISPIAFYAFLVFMITVDLVVVDKRYFRDESFRRKRDNTFFAMTESDQQILQDKSYYRVYNLNPRSPFAAFSEARTSYYHHSIGGYHGAKLRRYQEFIDTCFYQQLSPFFQIAQNGGSDFSPISAFNMLNIKYIPFGPEGNSVIRNATAWGNAWFVQDVIRVNNATEELAKTNELRQKTQAVMDVSRFDAKDFSFDSTATITLSEYSPRVLTYKSNSSANGLAVFSEIYYPEGWVATIDGQPAQIMRANYILRALQIPAGEHTLEFRFDPKPYTVGNKVTTASSWLVALVLVGCVALAFRADKPVDEPVPAKKVPAKK